MRNVAYKNDNPACLYFLVMSHDPFFHFGFRTITPLPLEIF